MNEIQLKAKSVVHDPEVLATSSKNIWRPHKSNQEYVVHDPAQCKGRPCCVHNPSDHHMKDWPQNFREDTGITERICEHGIGHPDPDQPLAKNSVHWIHGCDGCCQQKKKLETKL